MKVIMIPGNHAYVQKLAKILRKDNVSVKLFNSFHYSTPMNFLKTLIFRPFGYKIIHIHWMYVFPFTFMMKFYIKLVKRIGYKIVWTVHNVHPHENFEKDKKTEWFAKNVDYFFINYKSNVTKLGEYVGFSINKNKIIIIYHPSYEDIYPNTITQEEARKILEIPLDKKVALCFGQIRRYKGADIFAKAFELLDSSYCGLIVGEPKDNKLKNELEIITSSLNNILLVCRRISEDEIQVYLNACDVVVTPYRDITTSGVASLAFAFSKPFIATNKGSISEVVEDGKTGIIIDENTPNSIVDAIKRLFSMDYVQMGVNAHDYSKRFSWDGLKDSTINGYKKVLR